MTVQSTFTYDAVKGYPGDLVDAGADALTISRAAAAAVPFGKFVSRRATPADTDEQVGPPEVSASVTARGKGFARRDQMRKNTTGYEINDMVAILRSGRMWVECETAWTDGGDVFIRFAGAGSGLGSVRNDADTANAVALLNGACKFVGSGGSAGLAMIEINLP
jgi:hypothetical protein